MSGAAQAENLVSADRRPPALPSSEHDFQFHHALSSLREHPRRPAGGLGPAIAQAELAGLRRFLRQRAFHRVAHGDPAALGARHRTLDEDQAALDIGLHHLQIERGDALDAHVPGHLLVLEGLARILAAAGRTDRAVRDRHAVRGAQAPEVPALHAAGKALADRRAGDIDELTDDEMVRRDLGATGISGLADAEFRDLRFGSTLATAKWPRMALLTLLVRRAPEPSCSAT
jgi:hypothetical protein